MNLNELTIKQAHQKIKSREISVTELTKSALEKIDKTVGELNSFITVTEELALSQAEEIDKKIQEGEEPGILTGLPVAVKDNILIEDIKCTSGSKILENYIAPYDATVIKRLKKAGAVIVGKSNCDEFAMGSSGENSAYGYTKNPSDYERVTGGSSSGSAAAVAANQCIYALGSDTGGSIRQPASFCGVVGLKPTYGRISRYGLMAMSSSLDQIGPITKTVGDARIVYEAIKGEDRMDSTSTNSKENEQEKNGSLLGVKIGIPKEYFVEGLQDIIRKNIDEAIDKLKKLGAEVLEVNLPHTEYALPVYYIIMASEVSSNMARYDGVKYGVFKEAKNLLGTYLESRAAGLGKEVKRRIMLGTHALSSGYYDAYYTKARKVQALIKKDFDEVFKKVDVLATPVSPTVAFKFGEKTEDPLTMYLSDIFTIPVNLAGLPAISIPCNSHNKKELPVGLQIIANQFREDMLFKIGETFESN